MATIGDKLTAPESGWKRYDDSSGEFRYTDFTQKNWSDSSAYKGATSYNANGSTIGKIEFAFKGTKLRIISSSTRPERANSIDVIIDGVTETFSPRTSATVYQTLVYEKTGLVDTIHKVEIANFQGVDFSTVAAFGFDAVDIDSTGRLFHLDEVTHIKYLEVGKRIRCHYQASSGQVGVFSGLGEETSDFIPIASTATPNGDFYFIMVEDWNGNKKLISDRVIQHSITWDKLNLAGIANGNGIDLPKIVYGNDRNYMVNVNDLGLTIADTDDESGAEFRTARVTNNVATGKWYWEANFISHSTNTSGTRALRVFVGVMDNNSDITNGNGKNDESFTSTLDKFYAISSISGNLLPSFSSTGISSLNVGDTVGIALNLNEGYISFYNNGTLLIKSKIDTGIKWYPFYASKWLSKTTFNFGSRPFKYTVPQGYLPYIDSLNNKHQQLFIRLLTGGITSTDKNNEWDKYIVNSSLNEAITAGDNNVWNWNKVWSVTSTTVSGSSANRVSRGGSSVTGHGNNITSWNRTDNGFRPVLEIEDLTQYRSFVKVDGEYKKLDSTWQTISTTLPSVDTFMNEGMENLSVFDRKLTTFTIPMDDNTPQGQPLGNGKVFKEKINLKKYIEINSINVK